MSASFAEIAAELKMIAWREAYGVEALEILAARSNDSVFSASLEEARLSAKMAGEAHEIFRAMIPHETAVRQLLKAEQARAA